MLALRFDVDTRRGLDRAMQLSALLARHALPATFFVVMGREANAYEIVKLRLLAPTTSKSPLNVSAKGGKLAILRAAALPRRVGSAQHGLLRQLVREGHEVQPHGWSHIRWQRDLANLDPAEHVRKARNALVPVLGALPTGWASPGRTTDARALAAFDDAGLEYAGDLPGTEPFRPPGRTTLQLPVTHFATIAQMRADGQSDDDILGTWLQVAGTHPDYCCLYEHPDDLTDRELSIFDRLFAALRTSRECVTLSTVAARV